MHSKESLENLTNTFFCRHWSDYKLAKPQWSRWDLQGIPPQHNSGGCYAVFSNQTLLYVGVAITKGRSIKADRPRVGLYNRLRRHVIKPESRGSKVHIGMADRWNSITHIELIAFPEEYRYLAAALEIYIIDLLRPQYNKAV